MSVAKKTVKRPIKKIPQPKLPPRVWTVTGMYGPLTCTSYTLTDDKFSQALKDKLAAGRPLPEIKDAAVATLAEWKEAALILQEILTKIKNLIP